MRVVPAHRAPSDGGGHGRMHERTRRRLRAGTRACWRRFGASLDVLPKYLVIKRTVRQPEGRRVVRVIAQGRGLLGVCGSRTISGVALLAPDVAGTARVP